jgi:CRP-like cAMP-binding protein
LVPYLYGRYNCPRSATVWAASEGVLWALDRQTFQELVIGANQRKAALHEQFLGSVPLFKKLTKAQRISIASGLRVVTFKDGEVVVRKGDRCCLTPNRLATATLQNLMGKHITDSILCRYRSDFMFYLVEDGKVSIEKVE